MKKQLILTVLGVLTLFSCKNEVKNDDDNAFAKADSTATTVPNDDYKHSLAQWSLHKPFQDGTMDPMEFPQIAKDLGFTGVEYVTQLYPSVKEVGADYKERVMELATALNNKAQVAGMDNVLIMVDHAGELADPDPAKLKQAIENHKIWIDAAKVMGAHSVRANLFGELDPVKWHDLSVASLKELGDYGKSIGVNIIIENHGGWSSDAAKLVAVMKEVAMENVGVLPDFGNFCVKREGGERWGAPCVEEYDTYKGIKEMMPYAKGVSAKSYNFDSYGNETKLDYQRIMQIVADSGFKGYVGTEYEGPLEDPKKGIALTKALVQKSIENLK
ncbi:sugar phosphate isomerase/epimerase [Dokdonia sinensis]|uniref:Sugar phosphate isomerase/epimerase n=1 Tax=Dokdonia sinensis TaxID=2479847 RepID=A0A3M0GKY9_9FLAO|nr:sugar phosphate isomerase/epimerase family protein [Dokdonia sinensis]RMB63322.1 sugar phosphate isomerase/epimerase [Dokdonia sinensis]